MGDQSGITVNPFGLNSDSSEDGWSLAAAALSSSTQDETLRWNSPFLLAEAVPDVWMCCLGMLYRNRRSLEFHRKWSNVPEETLLCLYV